MIRLTELLTELEFASQEEFEEYSKLHNIRRDTEVIIAGRKTTAGQVKPIYKSTDVPVCKPAKTEKPEKEEKPTLARIADEKIYDFISDWIVSSLSDSEKRQKLLSRLDSIDIPDKYKSVPSEYLYRAQKKGSIPDQKYISYSYTIEGAKRMKGWLAKTLNANENELEIVKVPVSKVNILISIPTFFKATEKSSGSKFDDLWKKETEVIVKRR